MMLTDEKQKAWIQTYSGLKFPLFDPKTEDILLIDIAHSLSMQCRFNGHVKRFYSVAQHSVYVSLIVSPQARLYGLMHDAAEAYVSDVVSPLKACLPDFAEIEDRILATICQKFGIERTPDVIAEVHAADKWIVQREGEALLTNRGLIREWDIPESSFTPRCSLGDFCFYSWTPEYAEQLFVNQFDIARKEKDAA